MMERDLSLVDPSPLGERIRVVLVAPHPVQRTRLISLISLHRDLDVVAVAACTENLMRLCPHVRPDVVVVDSWEADMDGQALAQLIQSQWPWVQVLVLADALTPLEAAASERWKDKALLSERAWESNIAAMIRSLYAHRDGTPGWNGSGPRLRAFPDQALSRRESEVWQALKMGLSDVQISERLSVNELTARVYVRTVLDHLGLASRQEAAVAGQRETPRTYRARTAAALPERRRLTMAALPATRCVQARHSRSWR
jgi:DNA-binding NarL/FixJ family response regulator